MDFDIPESLLAPLQSMTPAGTPLADRLAEHGPCHGSVVVPSSLFDGAALNTLYTLAKSNDERALMFQLLALDNIHNAPEARVIPGMDVLINGLIAYLKRDAIDGWLYRRSRDGVLLPWLVEGMRHVVPDVGKPYVVIDLVAATVQSACAGNTGDPRMTRLGMTNAILVYPHDIVNRTIPQLLADRGYYKECAEFRQEYDAHFKRFMKLQPRHGQQLVAREAGFVVGPKGDMELVRLKDGVTARCVNDEEIIERRFSTGADPAFWRVAGCETGFDRAPQHCYLHLFHLELHRNLWVHVQNIAEYRYKPELKDKLVLPPDHRDLIDILTADMAVVMPDIVEGKSGGTTILCKGAPGLGKTLTAEVYAEVVGKPLYRVHSGQLGTTAESVEASLSAILRRAARWDSILLLDEADVYIRQRDNDLQHNAIVAEFLRTLEYFSGLLFMTTNRDDDIDDAILSRCIAIVSYELPTPEDAARLWRTLGDQFHANLSDALIARLVEVFTNASGRDIKELLKLTTKFCKARNLPMTEDAFVNCARFRGITPGR